MKYLDCEETLRVVSRKIEKDSECIYNNVI